MAAGTGGARRPRAPKTAQINRTRAAVLDATATVLVGDGYSAITIEKIAAESGVARSTIYRHWDNLADIVLDAVQQLLGPVGEQPDTGDLRSDLIALYEVLTGALSSGAWGKIVRGVVEAAMADEMFSAVLRKAIAERRENGRGVVQRGIDRGELPATTNIDWLLDSISGVVYYRMLMSGGPMNEDGMIEYLVDAAIAAANQSGAGS